MNTLERHGDHKMTQTMIEILETAFEPATKRKTAETLAKAVSNELMKTMPRLSPELFERIREANVNFSEAYIRRIDEHYLRAFHGYELRPEPVRLCSARIPIFAHACPPDQKEVVYPQAGNISYEETVALENAGRVKLIRENRDNNLYWECGNGISILEIRSVWRAPFKLDVCVKVPEVPGSLAELGDEALLAFFSTAKQFRKDMKSRKNGIEKKPSLCVLWAPTDESFYCAGDVPLLPKNDPALILEIPDPDCDKSYRHIVATWNIGEERPFKHWLAEYTA